MNFSEKRNIEIFNKTPQWKKDKVVRYLSKLGYKKEDILNPKLWRHFQAFYHYLKKRKIKWK